jgi:hypothetical protein
MFWKFKVPKYSLNDSVMILYYLNERSRFQKDSIHSSLIYHLNITHLRSFYFFNVSRSAFTFC